MKKIAVTVLAALLGAGFTSGAALADGQGNHGRHLGWRNRPNAQCASNAQPGRREDQRRRDNDDNDNGNDQNQQYGQYPQQNGQYGQYGQYGQQNGRCSGYSQNGSGVVRGTIASVNGNRLTIVQQNFSQVTIDDQPALNNRTSGPVSVGRFVTAYGYWRNGVFYAMQMN